MSKVRETPSMQDVEDFYPLAPMQEGMLFHTLYAPNSGVYVNQVCCSLTGDLDVASFEQTWQRMLERYPVLRACFLWENLKRPAQVVRRQVSLPLEQLEWRELSPAEQQEKLEALLSADRGRGFDLTSAPLMRLSLIRLADKRYQLVWSTHHALMDGWCQSLILAEISTIYRALSEGREPELPKPRPYRDFIAWLEKQDLAAAEVFWRRMLAGFDAPTPLVIDQIDHAPATPGQKMGEHYEVISAETTAALQALARCYRLTLSTLVHGAWALLLSSYSGERDIVFGTTVSGRPPDLEGAETMVGLFINTLPLRPRIEPHRRLHAWLQDLQVLLAEVREYEYTPLIKIQGWSAVPAGTALFDSVVVFENYPQRSPVAPSSGTRRHHGVRVANVRMTESGSYPLGLVAIPGSTLQLKVFHDQDRLSDDVIVRLRGHLRSLLERFVANPEQPLSRPWLLTESERRQLLTDWNATTAEYPATECIHDLFATQAEQSPDRIAAVFGDRWLSFRELDRRTGRLARQLSHRGVEPEVVVGLYMERSLEVVVGLLGILKAGGTYLPLDPDYPRERLELMIEDSGLEVLLTQERLLPTVPSATVEATGIESLLAAAVAGRHRVSAGRVGPDHLAYVIYTSGSTGRPKGVLVTHRGLCNLTRVQEGRFDFRPGSHVLQFSSLNFDASIFEICVGLAAGATVFLGSQQSLAPGPPLLRFLEARSISWMVLPPSVLSALPAAEVPALRTLAVAGEPCGAELAARWASGRRLFNAYGPTEATIWVTAARIAASGPKPPIGRPVENTRVYLLDPHGRPLPVAIAGELHLAGAGLARGYLGRAGLTAGKFVPDPLGDEPGGRLYKTGDLARYQRGGEIDFLGRVDQQVKILGFRIELGEIEAALRRFPSVHEAVVEAREDIPGFRGEKRLTAYLVAAGGEAGLSFRELRRFLEESLPTYMIPGLFVELETLPLNPSGKVDRSALPAPELEHRPPEEQVSAPRNTTEETLLAIWTQVLDVESIGIGDSFFSLGGDSILSLQIVAKAKEAGLELTPRQVFEYPTIAELAAVVMVGKPIVAEQGVVTGSVPLTPIQHWFFEQELKEPWHWNQAVFFEVSEKLEPRLIERTVLALLTQHDALRLRFRQARRFWRKRPLWQQVHAEVPSVAPFTCVDLSRLPDSCRSLALEAAAAQTQRSLNLTVGPTLRVVLFNLGHGSLDRLLIVMPHLTADGVSWGIFLEDLATAYRKLRNGQPLRLPPKTTSFKHWAHSLRRFANTKNLRQELAYWLAEPRRQAGTLPVDLPGGDNSQIAQRTVIVSLSTEETQDLLYRVPAVYRTEIQEVLLTALAQIVAEWTGESSVLVALEGQGREEIDPGLDLSRTVGGFTALFPVLLQLPESSAPGEALKSVKEQLRALPYRGIGYGLLRYLGPEAATEQLCALPEPQISFNYLGQLGQPSSTASLFQPVKEPSGPDFSPGWSRPHQLSVNGGVFGARLQAHWSYSHRIYRRSTIEAVAQRFIAALQSLIAHCLATEAGGYTPSDFPQAQLSQEDLDELVTAVSESAEESS